MPQALLAAAPDRMVWGSDWPHATYFKPMIETGPLLELLGRWAPDAKVRHRVLVENPAVLYGF
jgi:predicted TIM-barrel fold metal-dependent hydrolase